MKRYDSMCFYNDENGRFCEFTDHQAEIAKREALLIEARRYLSQSPGSYSEKISKQIDAILAQKDSTQ